MPVSDDTAIDAAILGSLDDLLRSLEMERVGTDRFRVTSDAARMFDRVVRRPAPRPSADRRRARASTARLLIRCTQPS